MFEGADIMILVEADRGMGRYYTLANDVFGLLIGDTHVGVTHNQLLDIVMVRERSAASRVTTTLANKLQVPFIFIRAFTDRVMVGRLEDGIQARIEIYDLHAEEEAALCEITRGVTGPKDRA